MKKALLIIATLVSTSSFASQCDIDAKHLKADYKITNSHKAQQNSESLTLWRNDQQVAHQRQVITELWQHLANKQIRPIRYFNAQQRGIEYQPSEVRGVQNWSAKNQLVDAHLIEKMTLLNTQGTGCDEVKNYTLSENGNDFNLAFITQSNLVKTFSVTNKKAQTNTVLSLNNVNSNKAEITAQFAKWDRFQTTDYADIGDNENDPFLAKMINLGFIEHSATGFYNQQGKAIQGGHHH
ncbi:hypothetical protein [Pseudoalteromonas sp. Z9A4]|uniref:hypothetical protein n=1 Tax=Pseudoalteromonas sp. Z9A4 TaxID=2686353 RepID=UPI001407D399|nr:hypothetical protein [Pseudoalteromonas sp. Z9A4]